MANSQPAASPGLRSSRRTFRRILHPDMTPMVGLGFLLVTFFLLAADFNKPTVMQLTMPVKSTDDSPMFCGAPMNITTLILGRNSQVHYYTGANYSYNRETLDLHTTNLSPSGLRQVILGRRQQHPEEIILIKPGPDAKYRDLVDVLDEINITDQKKYAIVDLYPEDYALLKQHGL